MEKPYVIKPNRVDLPSGSATLITGSDIDELICPEDPKGVRDALHEALTLINVLGISVTELATKVEQYDIAGEITSESLKRFMKTMGGKS